MMSDPHEKIKKQGQSRFYKVIYRFGQDVKTFAALVSKWR